MGKTLEIRLSDAQHAALSAEARDAGAGLFDYCRAKLTGTMKPVVLRVPPQLAGGYSTAVQVAYEDAPAKVAEFSERLAALPQPGRAAPADDRISRIEDAVARLTDYVLQGQAPAEAQHHQAAAPVDIDSLVNEQFAEAEAAGLTQHVPDEAEEQMDRGGVRPLSRRPIAYSSHSVPRHLQDMR